MKKGKRRMKIGNFASCFLSLSTNISRYYLKGLFQSISIRKSNSFRLYGTTRGTESSHHPIHSQQNHNTNANVQTKVYSESYTIKQLELIDIDQVKRKVFYIDEMPKDWNLRHPPIVIIGGTAQTINTFLPHIQAIRRKRRLIIFELRGQGQTELNSNYCSMNQLVKDVEQILQSLQVSRIQLAGFSFGGRVALAFTALNPSVVERLSITGVPLVRPPLGKMILQSWEDALSRGNIRECAWSFLINGYSDAFINQYASKIIQHLDLIIAANNIERLKNLIRFSHVMSEDDPLSIPNTCQQIVCPTQLIVGKQDRIAGYEECIQLADKIPHEDVDVLTMQTGHLAPFEDPIAWRNHLLKFCAIV